MLINRVSASAYPVTLADALVHLRQPTDEDGYVEALRFAAHDLIAEMSGRILGTETWAASLDYPRDRVNLPKSPVQSLVSISYYDEAGVSQTATLSDFYLFKDGDRASVVPKDGKAFPQLQNRDDALTIQFVAGYTALPPALRHAILLTIGHLYDNRSAVSEGAMMEVPLAVQSLVGVHKLGWAKG